MTFSAKPAVKKDVRSINNSASNRRKKSLMYYSPVLENNPFGRSMQLRPLSPAEQKTEKQFSALSDLVLIGTAVGPPGLSFAVFQDKSGESKQRHEVFGLGEDVFNYGVLKKIDRTYVEIEQGSVLHRVEMPEDSFSDAVQQTHYTAPVSSGTRFAKKIGEKQYLLDRRKVQEALGNPEQIMTDARLLPNFRDGKQEGFAMSEVIPGGLYHSLGLRNGDILLRINGLEMSNPEVAIQAMTALRGMDTITLDIIRGGKSMTISYQIR